MKSSKICATKTYFSSTFINLWPTAWMPHFSQCVGLSEKTLKRWSKQFFFLSLSTKCQVKWCHVWSTPFRTKKKRKKTFHKQTVESKYLLFIWINIYTFRTNKLCSRLLRQWTNLKIYLLQTLCQNDEHQINQFETITTTTTNEHLLSSHLYFVIDGATQPSTNQMNEKSHKSRPLHSSEIKCGRWNLCFSRIRHTHTNRWNQLWNMLNKALSWDHEKEFRWFIHSTNFIIYLWIHLIYLNRIIFNGQLVSLLILLHK